MSKSWKIILSGCFAGGIAFVTAMTASLTQAMETQTEVSQYALYLSILGALGAALKDWSAYTSLPPE